MPTLRLHYTEPRITNGAVEHGSLQEEDIKIATPDDQKAAAERFRLLGGLVYHGKHYHRIIVRHRVLEPGAKAA